MKFFRKTYRFIGLIFAISLIGGCASSSLSTSSSNGSSSSEGSQNMIKENTMLHFTLPLNDTENYPFPFIGDVHPYYDERTQMWYMFYLDTTGQFNSKLLTSTDGITWIENEDFWIYSSLANYGVLNIFEKDGVYFSYYAEYHSSRSDDLINWYYSGGEYQIPHDRTQFPGGMRDPSVTYDKDSKHYYAIALNYPRRIPSEGIYESNLAITRSIGDDQFNWEPNHNKVFAYNPMNQDFECPQLLKIGRRWYVVASQYGNSVHGVGRTSYLIGDLDKDPYEVNWQSKTLHHLNTEDLCAAQIAQKGDKFYIFGWIPRYHNAGFWGGYINLPTEVYALSDGSLATRLEENVASSIRGDLVAEMTTETSLTSGNSIELQVFKRFDYELDFLMENDGIIELRQANNNYRIVLTNNQNGPKVEVFTGSYRCFEYSLRANSYDGLNNLRVIGEGRNLEIELNGTYVLTSRIAQNLHEEGDVDQLIIKSNSQVATIKSVKSYQLKYLGEIQ